MAKSLQEARGSLISDIETLNDLLSSLGETHVGAGCRLPGKGQAVGTRGSPARWCWLSCSLAIWAELAGLRQRWLRVLAKLLEGSHLEESHRAE